MTSQILEKIKPILDFSLVSKFDIKDMEKNSYVPICISKGIVYVFTSNDDLPQSSITTIEAITSNDKITKKKVPDYDFGLLLNYIKSNLHIEETNQLSVEEVDESEESNISLKYDDEDDVSVQDEIVSSSHEGSSSQGTSDDKYFSKNWSPQRYAVQSVAYRFAKETTFAVNWS